MTQQFGIHRVATFQKVATHHKCFFPRSISAGAEKFFPGSGRAAESRGLQTAVDAAVKAVPIQSAARFNRFGTVGLQILLGQANQFHPDLATAIAGMHHDRGDDPLFRVQSGLGAVHGKAGVDVAHDAIAIERQY